MTRAEKAAPDLLGTSHERPALLAHVEHRRLRAAQHLDPSRRVEFGQFFTPAAVARLIANMTALPEQPVLRILDPGAGVGSLGAALVERFLTEQPGSTRALELIAYEIDASLHGELAATLKACEIAGVRCGVSVRTELRDPDYVVDAAKRWVKKARDQDCYDIVVMNPPYRKIAVRSATRRAVERLGVPVTNLYTAFLTAAIGQLRPGGKLVAITPRSFANGPYHGPFRTFLLERMALERVHVFESRSSVFGDAEVLQENVIFSATRGGHPSEVIISSSAGATDPPTLREVPYAEVIQPDDTNRFVRIPVVAADTENAKAIAALPASLSDLGIQVSTGRVVDFRVREALRMNPEPGAAPLIYPGHLADGIVVWPAIGARKPNALAQDLTTERLLLPNEPYVLVKRFSAKEERRRVSAALALPERIPGEVVAFENHLNVYHRAGHGLAVSLARGLAAFLSSSVVDRFIRQFNGHTQINAADLRHLRYPAETQLVALGGEVTLETLSRQEAIDELVAEHVRPTYGRHSG